MKPVISVKLVIEIATDAADPSQINASPVFETLIWNQEHAARHVVPDFTPIKQIIFAESVMMHVVRVLDQKQTNVSVVKEQTNLETTLANQNAKI